MSATVDQANSDILTVFKTAWDTTGLTALYENTAGERPSGQVSWARVSVRHGDANQDAVSGGVSNRRYERSGILTVQIFIPNGEGGLSAGYALGKVLTDAFEGIATPRQVWFRNVRVNEVGPDDEWFQFNFLADFTYTEVR